MMVTHNHNQSDEHGGHYHHPLSEVDWVATTGAVHMQADDYVVGISTGRQAYTIPWWVMKNHHVANLQVEGEPLVISFCEACSSSCCFDPVVDGQRLTFEWTGHYNGTILLGDEQTHSLWAPFTGEALAGELQGVTLQPRPLIQCTWEEWRSTFPESLVASGEGEHRDGHGGTQRPGTLEENFLDEATFIDERLPPNLLVLGVQAGSVSRAYPLQSAHEGSVVLNEDIGGEPIVVLSQAGSIIALAYSRLLDGRELTFDASGKAGVRDQETGTTWGWFGEALDGPLAGKRLSFVQSGVEEWYIWAAYHPGTEISVRATETRA